MEKEGIRLEKTRRGCIAILKYISRKIERLYIQKENGCFWMTLVEINIMTIKMKIGNCFLMNEKYISIISSMFGQNLIDFSKIQIGGTAHK